LEVPEDFGVLVLNGDPMRLTQILSNLIENAVKFTVNGNVKILIKTIKNCKESVNLQFIISDTGIGIPLDKQGLIFDSFAQASTSSTREYGGTGLGLTIVKNLLTLLNSNIKIKSKVGEGTSFEFEIRYAIDNAQMDQTNINSSSSLGNDPDISMLKILIAEDDQMNILLMRKLLAKWNLQADYVNNGLDAVEAFKNKIYDLILMDIHMPKMDGYEATKIIRKLEDKTKALLPIIALTASVAVDVKNKIDEVGISDFISKPFKPNELRAKLEVIASKTA
ncbi:MAG: response regulator, partial [Flavobacteriales bacterium]